MRKKERKRMSNEGQSMHLTLSGTSYKFDYTNSYKFTTNSPKCKIVMNLHESEMSCEIFKLSFQIPTLLYVISGLFS